MTPRDPIIEHLAPWDEDGFRQLIPIYEQSIPASERKHELAMRAMWQSPEYAFLVARMDERVIGFAAFFVSAESDFALLEYLAVETRLRNLGTGAKLFTKSIGHVGHRPTIVEIESEDIASPYLAMSRRRIEFYRRLGCRKIEGVNYLLPLKTSPPPPPMELMIHVDRELNQIPSSVLRCWLTTIYTRVHGCEANDPRIDRMLANGDASLKLA